MVAQFSFKHKITEFWGRGRMRFKDLYFPLYGTDVFMVLILDCNSEIGEHLYSEIGNLIGWKTFF